MRREKVRRLAFEEVESRLCLAAEVEVFDLSPSTSASPWSADATFQAPLAQAASHAGEAPDASLPVRGIMAISSELGNDVRQMPQLGVEMIRAFIPWNAFEPVQGQRDFSQLILGVQQYAGTGVRPVFVLRPISPWGTVCGASERPDCPPSDYEPWREFVQDLARQLEFADPIFEIGNEPNALGFWIGDDVSAPLTPTSYLDEYLEFLEETYTAIKEVSPDLAVMPAAMADGASSGSRSDREWVRHDLFYENVFASDHFDMIAVHNYYYPEIEIHGHTFRTYMERIRGLMEQAGKAEVPVIISEMGYSSETVQADGRVDFNDEYTQARRFEDAFQEFTDPELGMNIYGFVWLRLFDSKFPDQFPYFAEMGLADVESNGNLIPRPATGVFEFLANPVRIDEHPPSSDAEALPPEVQNEFEVRWAGTDDVFVPGAGISSYDVFVAVNDGPFTLWQQTTETSAVFEGEVNQQYRFYTVATDQVGRTEVKPEMADALTTVRVLPADIDEDRIVGFDDFVILSLNFGRSGVGRSEGDLTGDGLVSFDDFVFLSQHFGRFI